MAEQIGIIIENNSEGWATVLTDRKSACSGCHTGGGEGCRSCLGGSKLESRAANPIKAHAGDIVKINLRTSDLFKGAFILYLIPVLCLMTSAFIGVWIAQSVGWSETTGAVLAGGAGLVAGVALVIFLDRTRYVRRRMMPTITAVVTASAGQPASKQPSCCK